MIERYSYRDEQLWLHSFIEDFPDEVTFSIRAQSTMASYGVSLAEVLHVLGTGVVVESERDECGASISVAGRNCDEEDVEIDCTIVADRMTVTVNCVRKSI